jgi:hypothetical protein
MDAGTTSAGAQCVIGRSSVLERKAVAAMAQRDWSVASAGVVVAWPGLTAARRHGGLSITPPPRGMMPA